MIIRMFKSLFINKKTNLLTEKQKDTVLYNIDIVNFKRMKMFLIVLLIVELLFIGFNDIPYMMNKIVIWNNKIYFVIHLLLLMVSIIGIASIDILIKSDTGRSRKVNRMIVYGLVIVVLILISIANGFDQIKAGIADSVFISNLIIFSTAIMIKFPKSLIIYSIPFSTFVGGLLFFQKNNVILVDNIVNGVIFFIGAIVISKIIYDSQVTQISENIILEAYNRKLDYMSSHDPLTGLLNRRSFEAKAIEKTEILNSTDTESALVLIDIDHFKIINDTFGHPAGDVILKELSSILVKNIRDTDLVARWGGEEFAILILETSIDEAYELTKRLKNIIEKNVLTVDRFKISITVSFGISRLSGSFSKSFYKSYKAADMALYEAKSLGRNRIVIAK